MPDEGNVKGMGHRVGGGEDEGESQKRSIQPFTLEEYQLLVLFPNA
jgi:hypothetical protein